MLLAPRTLLLTAAAALLVSTAGSCAYKKQAKQAAVRDIECQPSLTKISKKRGVVMAKGCGSSERYMWACEEKTCKLNSFTGAIQESAFIADCLPEEMKPNPIDSSTLSLVGCDKEVVLKATATGWVHQPED